MAWSQFFLARRRWFHFDVVVVVHGWPSAGPDLDEADAAFNESAGGQDLRACVPSPYILRMFSGSFGNVEGVGRIDLHAVGRARTESMRASSLRLRSGAVGVASFSSWSRSSWARCGDIRGVFVFDVLDELFDLGVFRVDVGALKKRRQKSGTANFVIPGSDTARAHGDETGEVLIFGAKAVKYHDPCWAETEPRFAAIHEQERRLVIRDSA